MNKCNHCWKQGTRDILLQSVSFVVEDLNRIPPIIKRVTLTIDDKEIHFKPE